MGTRLPPERRLAEELGVSRVSLRAALARLASEGLLRSRQGSGVEVLDYRETAGIELFGWLLAREDAPPETTWELFREVVRMRRLLAIDTLLLAARRATPEDVAEVRALVDRLPEHFDEPFEYLALDHRIQRRILRITGSLARELLFNSLERVSWRHADLVLAFLGPLPAHHRAYGPVLQLLQSRHPQRWRKLAEKALDLVEARGLRRVRRHLEERARAAHRPPEEERA